MIRRPPRSTLFPFTTLVPISEFERAIAQKPDDPKANYFLGLAAEQDGRQDRKSTRLNSSHVRISYAVFCLKKKKNTTSDLLQKLALNNPTTDSTESAPLTC